ncbi:MAG: type II secretion system secretin GspD [Desulfobulbaceae bacterium]|nr:type II secretion system secretin GspD [Desulfobulbaceae bacterium]
MLVDRIKNIALLLLLLLPWGCSSLGEMGKNTIDIAGISKTVAKTPIQDCALDKGQDVSQTESEKKVSPIKDLAVSAEGGNPYLKKFPEAILSPEQDKPLAGEGVLLNFDNADIYEVVQVISEILDLSFIIDPQVKGMVNIRSGRKIPMAQLFPVFKKLLNINGLDIRSEGSYNYVYKVAKPGAQEVFGPNQAGNLADSSRLVIQIIPVMHLPAAEAKKLLDPYKSEQGSIDLLDNPNTLFISDYESKVVDMMMILAKIDVSPLTNFKMRMVRVDKAPLFNLRDELKEIMNALKVNKQGFEGVTIMALERVNSLLLVSSNQELIDSATRWINELDVIPSEGRDNVYIYNVRNSVASELSSLVSDLIKEQPSTVTRTLPAPTPMPTAAAQAAKTPGALAPPVPTPVAPPAPAVKKTGKGAGAEGDAAGPGLRFAGQPTLIADDSRNIILLRALPADYLRLQKLLERLDNMPRQVLIEVMVAEVALSDSWKMGIEWELHKNGSNNGYPFTNNLISNTSISSGNAATATAAATSPINLMNAAGGLTYSILNSAGEVAGILNAIADNNNLSILSSPQVMVLNNETATVNVGQSVPIVTSQTGDISSTTNLNQTIQYKDTGVILKVTPKINYDGIIILNIDQQVSSAEAASTSGNQSPRISNRQLTTKLAVRDGQTVFMGGLIENKTNMLDSGVPLLKDIPLLGWLFKYQQEEKKKTELLVMITPYVIETEDVLGQYVKSFNEKMDGFRKRLNAGVN